jgi:hypothetical protein
VNALRHLPNKTEGLKPVKKVLFEELVNLPTVAEFNIALLKMTNPIETYILNI